MSTGHLVSDVVIRPALAEDANFIFSLVNDCYTRKSISLEGIQAAVARRHSVMLVASIVSDAKPNCKRKNVVRQYDSIGALSATIADTADPYRHAFDLNFCAVAESYRRRGVATRLLRRACQRVVNREIVSRVSEFNLVGQQFLRACGLSCDIGSKVKCGDGDGGDVYVFRAESSDAVERAVCYRCAKYEVPVIGKAMAECGGR
mgnify:FL=1